jgi:hypothetical protein
LPIPVLGRIQKDAFLLDMRTLQDSDIPLIISALQAVAESAKEM